MSDTPQHSVRTHARYSPSAADRWTKCPSSVRLIESLRAEGTIPEDSSNDASRRGEFLHECTELFMQLKDTEALAHIATYHGKHPDLTADDALTLARSAACQARLTLDLLMDTPLPTDVHLERRYAVDEPLVISGTADVTRVSSEGVWVLDYKFGAIKIRAEKNTQLALYAYMAGKELLPDLADDTPVHLGIIQPPLGSVGCNTDLWTTTLGWVKGVVAECAKAFHLGEEAERQERAPQYHPGVSQCRFCRAAPACPALATIAHSLSIPTEDEMKTMTPQMLADYYDQSRLVAGVHQQIEELVRGGHVKDGFELRPGAKRTVWCDDVDGKEMETLCREVGTDAMYKRQLMPIKELSKDVKHAALLHGALVVKENKPRVARVPLASTDADVADLASSVPAYTKKENGNVN